MNKKKNYIVLLNSAYCIKLIVNVGGGAKLCLQLDIIESWRRKYDSDNFYSWTDKEANRSWQIHDPPWGNAPHV